MVVIGVFSCCWLFIVAFLIDEFNFAGILHRFANQMLLLQDGNNNAGREQFITAHGCRNCGEVKDEGSGREGDAGPCSSGPGAAVAMRTAGGTAVNLAGAAATSHPSPIPPGNDWTIGRRPSCGEENC